MLERVVYIGTSDWDDLVAEGQGLPEDAVAERMSTLDNNDPVNSQYTSGTTGFPKGAALSHRNILNNGFFATEIIDFTERDRLCIPVPGPGLRPDDHKIPRYAIVVAGFPMTVTGKVRKVEMREEAARRLGLS